MDYPRSYLRGNCAGTPAVHLSRQHRSSAEQYCARLGWPRHSRSRPTVPSAYDKCIPHHHGLSLLVCWHPRRIDFPECTGEACQSTFGIRPQHRTKKSKGALSVDVTNEELAHAANITPYTTSRVISEWHRTGAVRKHREELFCAHSKDSSFAPFRRNALFRLWTIGSFSTSTRSFAQARDCA